MECLSRGSYWAVVAGLGVAWIAACGGQETHDRGGGSAGSRAGAAGEVPGGTGSGGSGKGGVSAASSGGAGEHSGAGGGGALAHVSSISASTRNGCAVMTDGRVRCWGKNDFGQLGNGTIDRGYAGAGSGPQDVLGLPEPAQAVAVGSLHVCTLTRSGAVWCWGANNQYQLGNGSSQLNNSAVPVPVMGLSSGVTAISTSDSHTCAITADDRVLCWGVNTSGELGNGTTTTPNAVVSVQDLPSGVVAVGAGTTHTCALTKAGSVFCWGDGASGALGSYTGPLPKGATVVPGLSSVVAITVLGCYSCALTADNQVLCWGLRDALPAPGGDQYPVFSIVPVPVPDVPAEIAGISGRCTLTRGGAVRCWRSTSASMNGVGGNGDYLPTPDRDTPIDPVGLSAEVTAIAGFDYNYCALTLAGRVLCWGSPNYTPSPIGGL